MKKIFHVLLLTTFALSIQAQVLPSKVEVFSPFAKDIYTEDEVNQLMSVPGWGQNKKITNKRYWEVYSDRDENPTYYKSNKSSNVKATLKLGQKLRIAKIENGFALVYEDKNLNEGNFPQISNHATCYGWVPMDKLLLWNSCPTNSYGIYRKALIVINATVGKAKNNSKEYLKLYKNPDLPSKEKIRTSMKFYFIMKRLKNGMVLLSDECKGGNIIGWVNDNSYVPWEQRSCIEPNWDRDDVRSFINSNSSAYIAEYADMSGDKLVYRFDQANSSRKNEFDQYRMSPNILRYPILGNKDENPDESLYCCNVTTLPNSNTLNETYRLTDEVKYRQLKMLDEVSNMNIIFCIDATTSMEPYFKAVQDAIYQAVDYIDKETKLKIGVVLYRDYADGDGVVEYLPLTGFKDRRIKDFVLNVGEYGVISNVKDRTYTEALYKGLETAIDAEKMGFNKQHSNFVFVIGDCGNDMQDNKCLTNEELLRRLIDNNIQLFSFQVMQKSDLPWQLFSNQMTDLIKANIDYQYAALNNRIKVTFKPAATGNGYDPQVNYEELNNRYAASVRYGNLNEQMPEQELKNLIVDQVANLQKHIELRRIFINDAGSMNNSNNESDIVSGANQAFLRQLAGGNEETVNMFRRTNELISFIGYTKKRDGSGKKDLWKPVIFISHDELSVLLDKLAPLNRAAQMSDDTNRKPYVEAMKALLRSMMPDISESEMNKKGTQEIMNLIHGLNVSTDALEGFNYTLLEILDDKVVPKAEYLRILDSFRKKYKILEDISEGDYFYKLRSNGVTYYWIPVDLLP